ncbi:Protein Iojap chloroplastic [Bienertia sinuspersici]
MGLAVMSLSLINVFLPLNGTSKSPKFCRFQELGFGRTSHYLRPEHPFSQPMDTQIFQLPTNSSSLYSCKAVGSNINDDTDDMFDDLFKKHGKVLFRSNDKKPSGAEADDDAESLAFAVTMAKVANEVKAADIKVLFVKPLVYWTRFFIIATAFSRPQIDAIRTRMADHAEEKFGKVPNGDLKPNSWTLLDFGDVVVHIFLPHRGNSTT